jgi:hypothetical protein
MYDLASFASQLDPMQRQALMAQITRQRAGSDQLAAASARANSMNLPAAAAMMANNPQMAGAAKFMADAQQKQHAPAQMGVQGYALPSSGEFVPSPMFEEEQRAGRESREQIAQQNNEARLIRAREAEAARAERAHEANMLRKTLAGMKAAGGTAAPDKPKPGKTLPSGEVRKLSDSASIVSTFAELSDSFRDELSGTPALAEVQNTLGKYQPLGFGKGYADQSNWWSNYNEQKNIVRNKLFGSALTATEKAAFDKATISEGMEAAEIRRRLKQQQRAAARAYNKLRSQFGAAGYNVEDLEAADEGEDTPPPGGAVQSAAPAGVPQKVWDHMTPEERSLWK